LDLRICLSIDRDAHLQHSAELMQRLDDLFADQARTISAAVTDLGTDHPTFG
jgi:hypothetical protein